MQQNNQNKLYISCYLILFFLLAQVAMLAGRKLKPGSDAGEPAATASESWQTACDKLPLSFEINRGQAPKPVEFLARGDGYHLSLLPNEAVLTLAKTTDAAANSATLRIKLDGANQHPRVSGLAPLRGKSGYFLGDDPRRWRTDAPIYAKVKYEGVYPGVDAVFYGNQQQFEYDFIVAPGADPRAIRLDFAGAREAWLEDNGDLVLKTDAGEVRQRRPVVYQEIDGERRAVTGRYWLKGCAAGFELGAYNASFPLIITRNRNLT